MPLFDSEFLKKLEYLSLISKRVFRGSLMAQRRTMQLGSGIEFADHREYAAGDDFRYLDWNLFARHNELLLKRFQEEEDLHVYFLVDCSRSMAFGEPSKFDFARQVAAALAYIALADLDRIAVTAFANDIVADFPLTRGKGRILSLLKFFEGLEAQGEETNLERVATGFIHRDQRRGLVVVLSDLYDPNGFERGLDLLRHRKYEPFVVQVFDKYEKEPPDLLGDVEMWDVESGNSRKVTVTEKNLKQYRQLFDEFQTTVQSYCNRYSLGCTRTSTEISFDELILKMMRQAGSVR
ncbi:DUF58 domain-containing protein [Limnoglobus roseus]|uniref:DUF58 domain-containing protein n=1 Tax=Limnoglobus roseus TaxID=2598579 RepID=A0A5C1AR96_9BACT|nr:DUF58 domain-containing protein [Limnoglobus roseus]QEL19724.1 hypothetical protein PX52LOC_06803 [Limnoglobus roseus]